MTKIKFCGLRRMEDIEAANELLPNYIGFVFAPTKRQVTPKEAQKLKDNLSTQIEAVGVFVNHPLEEIISLCNRGIIDMVQLHGDEDEDFIRTVKELTNCPVIKAVRVRSTEDILKMQDSEADYLLLDTYKKGEYGGTGEQFDWNLIPKIDKPFFLAGGIKADNIQQAIADCGPYALDLSTALETDGFKDKAKMEEVIEALRGDY